VNWSRNHRKAISFAFILLSNAAILSGCAARSRGFSFEDYKSNKEVLIAQEKLQSMFPVGTDVEEFTKFMKELKAQCNEYDGRARGGERGTSCYYYINVLLLSQVEWSISVKTDDNRKITELSAGRDVGSI
jgi:hypothetical protein